MAIIYPYFLNSILTVHEWIQQEIDYPLFDPACIRYEALRAVAIDKTAVGDVLQKYGLTEYDFKRSDYAFHQSGVAGLIGLNARQLTEELPPEIERMVYVLKQTRP